MKQQDKRDKGRQPQPKFAIIDRRHKSAGTGTVQYQPRYPTFVEQLQQRLAAKDQQLKEYLEKLKQENEAYKQRLEREAYNRQERERIQLFSRLLPVLDNLGRALASAEAKHSYELLLQGLKQVTAQFWAQLQAEGVTRLETVGKRFEVVAVKKRNQDQIVMEEVEAGYMLGDKLIRPARVKVGQFK
jgi:molecular chaperone GrpE